MSMEMGFLCRRTFEQRVVACTTNVRRAHQDEWGSKLSEDLSEELATGRVELRRRTSMTERLRFSSCRQSTS
jgi:hypothetical protein